MGESNRELYLAVFGTDSDDEEDLKQEESCVDGHGDELDDVEDFFDVSGNCIHHHEWRPVDHVDGLWRCESFLDSVGQESLVAAIESEGWFILPSNNQAMRFGVLPGWAVKLSELIWNSVSAFVKGRETEAGFRLPLAKELLQRRPLFDQMIVNSYQPGEGIGPHVDLAQFEDGIAVLSLLSSCVMQFRKCEDATEKVGVLLLPGDLILLSVDARYKWTHEINRDQKEQVWAGTVLEQERRLSVTLRRLCPDGKVQSM